MIFGPDILVQYLYTKSRKFTVASTLAVTGLLLNVGIQIIFDTMQTVDLVALWAMRWLSLGTVCCVTVLDVVTLYWLSMGCGGLE